jgi:Tol biopolymer transport system component/class 3 adenylate cyclase
MAFQQKERVSPSEAGRLRTAHVVFVDIVGYSLLATDEQNRAVHQLQSMVTELPGFAEGFAADELICIPTGDGMAIACFGEPTAPVQFARDLAIRIRQEAPFALRIGLHNGPVYCSSDINDNMNVAGGGINIAQRIMDCGDGGHILVSQSVAETLLQLTQWRNAVQDLGECEVKHGLRLRIFNLATTEFGNPVLPAKIRKAIEGGKAVNLAGAVPPLPDKRSPDGPGHPDTKRRRWLIAGAAAIIVFAAGWAAGVFVASRGGHAPPRAILRRITWDDGLAETPALSNDGRLLAFASDRADGKNLDIFVRHMSGGEPIRLTNDPADDTDPSFSPGGGLITFRSERQGGGIYVMPSLGGQERLVAPRGNNPRFSPDGKWIAYWTGEVANNMPSARAWIVPASGGAPRQLQPSFADARYPVWTPDGAHILFEGVDVWKSDADPDSDWWVTAVREGKDNGKAVKTGAWDSIARSGLPTIYQPGGWHGGRVVFSARDDAARLVLDIPISTRTWRVQGLVEALTFGTGVDGDPYPTPSGAIAFTSSQYEINIWSRSLDESGRVGDREARKLTSGAAYHTSASMNAGGTRLVFLLGRNPSRNVWIKDLATGREAAVTVDGTDKCSAAISADGSKVAWSVCGPGQEAVYVAAVNPDFSVPVSEKVCEDCGRVMEWSRTGNSILFVDHSHPVRAGILALSSRSSVMISSQRYNLDRARFSSDGNWIALTAAQARGDRAQIFAIPLRDGKPAPESDWVAITSGGFWDDIPVWTERGDALLFYSRRDGFGCIWRQAVNRTTKRPEGPPAEVIQFHSGRRSIEQLSGFLPSLFLINGQILFNALETTGSIWVLDDGLGARAED